MKLLHYLFFLSLVTFSAIVSADPDTKLLIGGYGPSEVAWKQLNALPADKRAIPAGNAQALYLPSPTNPLAITLTLQQLSNFFNLNPGAPISIADIIVNAVNNIASFGESTAPLPVTTGLYATCTGNAASEGGNFTGCLQKQQAPTFANVDLNSLVGPLVYQKGQDKAAGNFITAIATLNVPLTLVNLPKVASTGKTDVATLTTSNKDVVKYINELRLYAAMQAIGLSNLNQFYAERMPSKVTETANKPLFKALNALGMPNASQLQVENYMATRRITDPDWVNSLAQDSPAALMRQMVILLAENLAELYNNRMTSERMTATLTAMELGQAANLRIQLEQDINTINNPPQQPSP